MHYWSFQAFSEDYSPNLRGETYSLEPILNGRFFDKLFMAILFTVTVFARNLLRRNTFCILFLVSGLELEPYLYV